jgi:hypothetical protein
MVRFTQPLSGKTNLQIYTGEKKNKSIFMVHQSLEGAEMLSLPRVDSHILPVGERQVWLWVTK